VRRERAGGRVVDGAGAHDLDDAAQALGGIDGVDRHERRADGQRPDHGDEERRLFVAVYRHRHVRPQPVAARLPGPGGRFVAQLRPAQAAVGAGDGERLGREFGIRETEGFQVETHADAPGVK